MTDAERWARLFHDTYETLAPEYGYETRPETREFDPTSSNGRLMMAVCANVVAELLASQAAEIERLRVEIVNLRKNAIPPTSMLFKPCTCSVTSRGVRSLNPNCAVHRGDTP